MVLWNMVAVWVVCVFILTGQFRWCWAMSPTFSYRKAIACPLRGSSFGLFAVASAMATTGLFADAWIPPPPSKRADFETVHQMRRRLGKPFNYSTTFIDAEMCRYLSEEECEESEQMMEKHISAHKQLQKQVQFNPNLGSINVLVLMVRFSDHTNRDLIPKSAVDEFWQINVPEWLDVNSQGRYKIDATVIDWITTDNTEEYYSFGQRGIVREAQQMAWPSLDNLDNRAGWDWSKFDLDGNGALDSVVIMHSGYGAESTTEDCFGRDHNNRIWAHAYSGSKLAWESKDGSIKISGYTIASAFEGDCGTEPAKIGLTVHEYMHTLGLVDLYDGVDPLAASGIGSFDIMSDPYGTADDPEFPGHLSIWSKIRAEWLEPIMIEADGEFDLQAAELSDEGYRIDLSSGPYAEYLLIENRQPLEFDKDLWTGGLVIYHIDDIADLQMKLGHPDQEGWPENGNHYQVALLPKDGNYDLEKGNNEGDAGDFWLPGDSLGPGPEHPNTDTYQGGFVTTTGVRITVLEQSGTNIRFQVGLNEDSPGVIPVDATSPPTATPSVLAASGTQSPTVSTATAAPTAGTTSPTLSNATAASSTQAPSSNNVTAVPTVPATSSPTQPSLGQLPIPFGNHGQDRYIPMSTQRPTMPTEPGYLSSFGPYAGRPTGAPNNNGGFLSNFQSFFDAQLGPPKEEGGFLSGAFDSPLKPNSSEFDAALGADDERAGKSSSCTCGSSVFLALGTLSLATVFGII